MSQPSGDAFALEDLEQLHRKGHLRQLRTQLAAKVSEHIDSPHVTHLMGLLLAQWGDADEAIVLLEESARLQSGMATVHNDLGVVYCSQNRLMEASRSFQRALECDAEFKPALDNLQQLKIDSLMGLARVDWHEGRLGEARARVNEVLRCSPGYDQAIAMLAAMDSPPPLSVHVAQPGPLIDDRMARETRLRALFQQMVLICVRHRIPRWWDYRGAHSIFHANSFQLLRWFLGEFVLRRAGDYQAYLQMSRELDSLGAPAAPKDTFLVELAQRFAGELALLRVSARKPAPTKRPFVLAFPVWGAAYIDCFLTQCVPSLLAPGNFPALSRERAAILLIHTDSEGEQRIRSAPIMRQVSELGIDLRFMKLDSRLLARVPEHDYFKYWHLGFIQSIQLLFAKMISADFHILLPDTIYATDYFRNLLQRAAEGKLTIVQAAFRTEAEKVAEKIAPYRSGTCISAPAADLMTIALNCMHPSMHFLRVNDRPSTDVWPTFHALLWEEESSLHFISPHQTIGYLDGSIVSEVPERLYCTLDSELDKILPEQCTLYSPRPEDGLVLIELSPGGEAPPPARYSHAAGYIHNFWHSIENRRHLEFFEQDILFPIRVERRNPRRVLSRQRIEQEKSELRRLVRDGYPVASVSALVNGLLSLNMAETHPLAESMVADLRESARTIWHSGRQAISPESPVNLVRQILRMLWHFDLLDEVRDCLARCPCEAGLLEALDDWERLDSWNTRYADSKGPATARPRFVAGVTVWGRDYLEFFRDYHLPSLLAEGNLPYLAQRGQLILSIVTDEPGRTFLESSAVLRAVSQVAEIHFSIANPMPQRKPGEEARIFYMRYGLLDHLHVYLARRLQANLLLMPSDTVISRLGLATLAEQIANGFDCCTVACIEAYRDPVRPLLDTHRAGTVLALEASELMDMAVRHKTDYFRSLVVNPERRINAYPRELFWRVQSGYVCHSLFMHPVMLSARVLSRPFHPNHENVDWALLPRVLQADGKVKVLDDTSGLFILHCSDRAVRSDELSNFAGTLCHDLASYLLSVHQHDFPVHRRLFAQPQFFAVDDADEPVTLNYSADVAGLLSVFNLALTGYPVNAGAAET